MAHQPDPELYDSVFRGLERSKETAKATETETEGRGWLLNASGRSTCDVERY